MKAGFAAQWVHNWRRSDTEQAGITLIEASLQPIEGWFFVSGPQVQIRDVLGLRRWAEFLCALLCRAAPGIRPTRFLLSPIIYSRFLHQIVQEFPEET